MIKLICNNIQQLKDQMKNRPNNGLIDYELQQKLNEKILSRQTLINEYIIDITEMTVKDVLQKAITIIDNTTTLLNYDYKKPEKNLFYSWVFSNGLR